ncbi:MAG: hypothetical protein H6642_09075 [Caldilineaceae bacterium]|nr:hypothetical protein [Caldilineaceae bacterium]
MNFAFTSTFFQRGQPYRYGFITLVLVLMTFLIPSSLHAQGSNIESEFGYLVGELLENEPVYGGAWIQREPEYGLYIQFASPDGEDILQAYADRYPFVDQIHVSQSQYSYKGLVAMQEVLIDFCSADNWELFNSTSIEMYEQNMIIFLWSETPVEAEQTIVGDVDLIAAVAAAVDEPEPERVLNVISVEYSEPPVDLDTTYRVLLPIAAVR